VGSFGAYLRPARDADRWCRWPTSGGHLRVELTVCRTHRRLALPESQFRCRVPMKCPIWHHHTAAAQQRVRLGHRQARIQPRLDLVVLGKPPLPMPRSCRLGRLGRVSAITAANSSSVSMNRVPYPSWASRQNRCRGLGSGQLSVPSVWRTRRSQVSQSLLTGRMGHLSGPLGDRTPVACFKQPARFQAMSHRPRSTPGRREVTRP
jgi:hypothetical protein